MLSGLLKAAPDSRATQTLRLVREQRAEAEAVAGKVRECLRKYDIRQATAELETARAKYPDETGWTTLQVEIDARQAALRQQSAVADSLRECLKRGDFRAAAAKLAEGRSRHQNDALWSTLQAEIDARQGQAAEMAERIRECVRRGDIAEATAQLAAARTNCPGESRWTELQKEIEARQAETRAESVRACLKAGDWGQAEAQLDAARRSAPNDGRWADLQQEVDASKRRAETASVAENVRELLRRGDADQAEARLAAARTSYPGDRRWAEIQREVDARLEESNADRVRECLSAGDLAQAAEQLAAARSRYPNDDRWTGLQTQIDGARRQAAIAAALESVREWLKRGNIGQAAAQLAAARSNYPDEPGLVGTAGGGGCLEAAIGSCGCERGSPGSSCAEGCDRGSSETSECAQDFPWRARLGGIAARNRYLPGEPDAGIADRQHHSGRARACETRRPGAGRRRTGVRAREIP